jgi:CubicO group peptidase (beta-lactamase class C family)
MVEGWERLPRTLAALEQGRQAGLHLGAQLYVSVRGEPLAAAAMGENTPPPSPNFRLSPEHLMPWLSMGKPVTALAIAQLRDRKLLRLDDPVARHLPEFGAAGKEAITLEHLLTHTGGFRTADHIPDQLGREETLELICQTPLEPGWIPGQKAAYQANKSSPLGAGWG